MRGRTQRQLKFAVKALEVIAGQFNGRGSTTEISFHLDVRAKQAHTLGVRQRFERPPTAHPTQGVLPTLIQQVNTYLLRRGQRLRREQEENRTDNELHDDAV
jgi:hypothetical protein